MDLAPSPGTGALPPRAWWSVWDARRLSLGGAWRFRLSVRPWTAEGEDAAAHTHELTRGDTLGLHLDHALHGVGSHACGPEAPPEFRLTAAPAAFGFTFTVLRPAPEENL